MGRLLAGSHLPSSLVAAAGSMESSAVLLAPLLHSQGAVAVLGPDSSCPRGTACPPAAQRAPNFLLLVMITLCVFRKQPRVSPPSERIQTCCEVWRRNLFPDGLSVA